MRTTPPKIEPRMTRVAAAAWFTEQTGVPMSPRTLEKLEIPYCVLVGRSMYHPRDIELYIQKIDAGASRRTGSAGRHKAA